MGTRIMDDSYYTSSCGSHIQPQKENDTHGSSLFTLKDELRSIFPRQRFGQEMGQILSSWRACFVIILSKSVLSQIQTIPNMHPVREIGQIAKLMIFSFPCFKGSHPHKTHYNIMVIPFCNSCQEPTNLLTPPLKQSKLLRYLRSFYVAKFPFLSAWVYLRGPLSL